MKAPKENRATLFFWCSYSQDQHRVVFQKTNKWKKAKVIEHEWVLPVWELWVCSYSSYDSGHLGSDCKGEWKRSHSYGSCIWQRVTTYWFRLSRKAMFLLHVFSFPVWVELRTQILLKCINSFLNVSYQSGRNERNYWSTPEGQSFKLVYFTRCIVKKKKSNAALMPSQRCGRTVLSIEQDNRLGSASN